MHWATTLVTLSSVLGAAIVFSPEISVSQLKTGPFGDKDAFLPRFLKTLHLFSFATCFGISLWVTFIGGIIMFRNLPRHMFGSLQGKLFPAYFRVQVLGLSCCLATFAFLHPWGSASPLERVQIQALAAGMAGHLLNLLIFEPHTTQIMKERHKMEKELGIGSEVGLSKNKEVAKTNPKLATVNKRFGKAHGMSSLANLAAFGALVIHLWYLSCQLHL